jgi:hypothetical protein
VNPSRPLKREMLEELQKEQPSALIELVMRMQEALEEMRQEVGRLQRLERSGRADHEGQQYSL